MDKNHSQSLQNTHGKNRFARRDFLPQKYLDREAQSNVLNQSTHPYSMIDSLTDGLENIHQRNHHPSDSAGSEARNDSTRPITISHPERKVTPRSKSWYQSMLRDKKLINESDRVAISHDVTEKIPLDTHHFELCIPVAHQKNTPMSDISIEDPDWLDDLYSESITTLPGQSFKDTKGDVMKDMNITSNESSRQGSRVSQVKRSSKVVDRTNARQLSLPCNPSEDSYLNKSAFDYLASPEWQKHEKILLDWRCFMKKQRSRSSGLTPGFPSVLPQVPQESTFSKVDRNRLKKKVQNMERSDSKLSLTKKRNNKKSESSIQG